MEREDKDHEIEKLSQMLSKIQNIYYKKKEQLEELQIEIDELKEVINYLNSLISNKSFTSADEIYQQTLKIDKKPKDEKYFIEEIPKEKVRGTNIKRKIFTKNNNKEPDLLCVLNFYDLNSVEIKLIDPEKRAIKETSEDFIQIFLKGALIKIKENNSNMDLAYLHFQKTDLIETIKISNLNSISEYDLITSKISELLAKEITN
ncbi:MAG: hypothetical protein ACFFB0_03810 [Promethearchaeota archaeon]